MAIQNGPRYPGPSAGGGGGVPQVVFPVAPSQAAQQQQGQGVQINFPQPNPPIINPLIQDQAIRGLSPSVSTVFFWPRAGPLGIRTVNGLDATVTVQVFSGYESSTGRPGIRPILEMDVASGETVPESLNPDAGDPWAPWVWVVVTPKTAATNGTLRVDAIRLGDL